MPLISRSLKLRSGVDIAAGPSASGAAVLSIARRSSDMEI